MGEMESLLAKKHDDDSVRMEKASLHVQDWVNALVRGVVMVVQGEPLKVFVDPVALTLSVPVENLEIELDAIQEMVFSIATVEGFNVPELVVKSDRDVRFQFENQRARLLF